MGSGDYTGERGQVVTPLAGTQLPAKNTKQFCDPREWERPRSLPAVSTGAGFGLDQRMVVF